MAHEIKSSVTAAPIKRDPTPSQPDIGPESSDSSWDAGPAFAYWPLQNLYFLAQGQFTRQPQEKNKPISRKGRDLGSAKQSALAIMNGDVAPPVHNAVPEDRTSPLQHDHHGPWGPFQHDDFNDGTGTSAYAFQDSPEFQHEPLLFDAEYFGVPFDPRPPSPASTITSTPTLDHSSRPGSRAGFKTPPGSPQASPITYFSLRKLACTECDKYFTERSALRFVVRPSRPIL